ncbi:hypothetical protein F5X96DRAFT_303227 [Biscogniauxia mediterranea]|nr:hypothetical protein F5X96DRAFT_303227 [Biscogniauxia mediterranea]
MGKISFLGGAGSAFTKIHCSSLALFLMRPVKYLTGCENLNIRTISYYHLNPPSLRRQQQQQRQQQQVQVQIFTMAEEAQDSLSIFPISFTQLDIARRIVATHAPRLVLIQPHRLAVYGADLADVNLLNALIASATEKIYQERQAVGFRIPPFRPKVVIQVERHQPSASCHRYPANEDMEAEVSCLLGRFETALPQNYTNRYVHERHLSKYLEAFFSWVKKQGEHEIFYGPLMKILSDWLQGWDSKFGYNLVRLRERDTLPPKDENGLLLSELAHAFPRLLEMVKRNRRPETTTQETAYVITISKGLEVRFMTATITMPAYATDDIIFRAYINDTMDFSSAWSIRAWTGDTEAWHSTVAKFLYLIATRPNLGTGGDKS